MFRSFKVVFGGDLVVGRRGFVKENLGFVIRKG